MSSDAMPGPWPAQNWSSSICRILHASWTYKVYMQAHLTCSWAVTLDFYRNFNWCYVRLQKLKSIEGLSLLNNFTYEESGIHCWKVYKAGKGKLINYADPEQQRPTSLKIIEAYDSNRSTTGTMMTAKSSSDKCSSLFSIVRSRVVF